MAILLIIGVSLLGYIIGSIPFGLLIVKLATGKDIRTIQSGRTGGTNAMRAAGFWAGLSTALCDILKGASGVWIVRSQITENPLILISVALATIVGHNYSIFLIERNKYGRLRLRGGAGGATVVGGAMALWAPSILILIPVGIFFLFVVGYASVATMSFPIAATIAFAIRAIMGFSPWEYVLYGFLAEIILVWSLRPNIKRLLNGTERVIGLRANQMKSPSRSNLNQTQTRSSTSNH